MKIIYKYTIVPNITEISLPKDAEILCVQIQYDSPRLWVLLDPYAINNVKRIFKAYVTGQGLDERYQHKYIGTFQLENGILVYHLFELL